MTKDKFNKIGNICCEFQHRILAEIAEEPDQQDAIDSTAVVKELSRAFGSVASSIESFLEDVHKGIKDE